MKKEPLLFAFLLCYGYLFVLTKPMADPGIGIALFGLFGLGALTWYLLACKKKISPAGVAILIPAAALILSFALFENSAISEPLCLCAVFFSAAFAYFAGGKPVHMGGFLGMARLFTLDIFSNLQQKAQLLFGQKKDRRTFVHVLIGLIAALPILFLLLGLLSEADLAFESAVNTLFGLMNERIMEQAAYIIAALAIGSYLYSLFLSAAPEKGEPRPPLFNLPATVCSVLLLCVNLLFLFFFSVQIKGIMETGTSAYALSMLAREGFFELCFVCGINFLLFTFSHKLIQAKTPFLKAMMFLLCAMTQLIVLTTVYKMSLYAGKYGLTLLRVQTLWFMVSLFLAFIVMEIRLFKSIPLTKWVAALCVLSITLISYANIGGLVAKTNVDRFLKGELKTFDMTQYSAFPYEAAPALIALYQETQDETVKSETLAFLQSVNRDESPNTLQQLLAGNALDAFLRNP